MTDKATWRILDAWREDTASVTFTSGVVNCHAFIVTSVSRLVFLIAHSNSYYCKWYIDGKEVTDEEEVEGEA